MPLIVPGVYVEVTTDRKAITGVATANAGFVGFFSRGAVGEARSVASWADFEREFGGLHPDSLASFAIQQFFLNGGQQAWVVRAADPAPKPTNGDPPGADELKAAIHKLDAVELINLISVPDTDRLSDGAAKEVIDSVMAYAEARGAFYIVDAPNASKKTQATIKDWVATVGSKNAAAYFPRVSVANPFDPTKPKAIPNSGSVAGVYARTDTERGVWKAPAGTAAQLRGVQELEASLTDAETRSLDGLGVNTLRTQRLGGNVIWGARTLAGSNARSPEWKYVAVRRLALFLEQSLQRGTQFAVFEPSGEQLWVQLRASVEAFMRDLFTRGVFPGRTLDEAYFVRCDRGTMTQADIDWGIVNFIVGFAPIKPAEFVILRLTQLTSGARP